MPGPPPKPTRLKQLAGNPGKHRLNRNEPQPRGVANMPPGLDAEARKEWRRISAELEALGLLTAVDRAVMSGYCRAWSIWYTATRELTKLQLQAAKENTSGLVAVARSGYLMPHPPHRNYQ